MQLKFVLSALLLSPVIALAAEVSYVTVEKDGSRYQVQGEVMVEASSAAVLRLLTDYDSLDQLDKGILESRLVERLSDNVALVYTRISGCILFFCRKIDRVERVEQISATELIAEVVPGDKGNVTYERSRWRFAATDAGTRIIFDTDVEPDFWVPAMVGPAMIKRVLKKRVGRTLANLEDAARAYE